MLDLPADTAGMDEQLTLFESARYHDPRVAADRARVRALAKLRRCGGPPMQRGAEVLELRRPSTRPDRVRDVRSAA